MSRLVRPRVTEEQYNVDGTQRLRLKADFPTSSVQVSKDLSGQAIGFVVSNALMRKTHDSTEDYGVETSMPEATLIGLTSFFINKFIIEAAEYGSKPAEITVALPVSKESQAAIDKFKSEHAAAVEEQAYLSHLKGLNIPALSFNILLSSLNAYHGYKRHNDSYLWGLGWLAATSMGLSNVGFALNQGFAKPLPTEKVHRIHNSALKTKRSNKKIDS